MGAQGRRRLSGASRGASVPLKERPAEAVGDPLNYPTTYSSL
jgi:hypothetical protein